MKFNNKTFDAFRAEATKLLAPLAEKYPLDIKATNISYAPDNSNFTMKVECTRTDMGDLKEKEFAKHCFVYDMKPEDYNREFVYNGKKYRLVGFSLGSPKYPCIAVEVSSGKEVKFVLNGVKAAFGWQNAAAGGQEG